MRGTARFNRVRLGLLVAALLGVFVVAGTASASPTVTIGQTSATPDGICFMSSSVQQAVTSGTSYVVPAGIWALTSWSTFANSVGGSVGLIVFRPGVGGAYTVVGESPVQSLIAGVLNTFPASITVQGGDVLGMWAAGGAGCGTFTTTGNQAAFFLPPEPGVGSSVNPSYVVDAFRLNISATLGPSVDALLADLLTAVTTPVQIGPGGSLFAKMSAIQSYVSVGDAAHACSMLNAFIHEVKAQSGKSIGASIAPSLITQATDIKNALGC